MRRGSEKHPSRNRKMSVRQRVVDLISPDWLFADEAGTAYLDINLGEGQACRQEVHALHSLSCKRIIRRLYFDQYGAPPSASGLKDGIDGLDALAQDTVQHVGLRTTPYQGGFAIDRGDPSWTRLVVRAGSWEAMPCGPRIRRGEDSLALPEPIAGGNLRDLLRGFINVASDADLGLIISWLVFAMQPHGSFPILVLQGEQGASKSTLAKMLVALSDPKATPLLPAPEDDRDLMVIAKSRHVLAFDNVSSLSPRTKDALCRLATGSGHVARRLYTDSEVVAWHACCPAILNGINNLILADDLADRALAITLPAIPTSARRSEAEFSREFNCSIGRIFGAMLDAAAFALAHPVTSGSLPRMADFAKFAMAACPAWGSTPEAWLADFEANRCAAVERGLDGDPVAQELRSILWPHNPWVVTTGELYRYLERHDRDSLRQSPGWPKSPRALGDCLRRLAPAMRSIGFEINELGRQRDGYKWRLQSLADTNAGERRERCEGLSLLKSGCGRRGD